MASIARDKNGHRRILFVAPDGRRPTIRLGKVSQRAAESVKFRVEQLLAAKLTGHALETDTAGWIADLDSAMAVKLARVGLIPKREASAGETITLDAFINECIASRPGMKPNTLKNYRQTQRSLVEFFGTDRRLTSITPGDCDDWHNNQIGDKYAPATISRNVKRAKQFFRTAVRRKLINENPLADVKSAAQVNKAREHFVPAAEIDAIMAACPDAQWRLIVALARYGGLRTPSETFGLRWCDVDWKRGRLRVNSPKTEHHPGGESRVIPLFPELKRPLEDSWELAEPGTEFIIDKHRNPGANLRTQLLRIMERAGVKAWPRLFQNMRASRETELTRSHPLHVVVAWIGNSASIAAKHYLQVTDSDFESAVNAAQNAAQSAHATERRESQVATAAHEKTPFLPGFATACDVMHICSLPPAGVEPALPD